MATDLQALKNDLEAKGPLPVYVIQGAERLMVDAAVKLIVRYAVDDPKDAMAVTRVDLAEAGTSAREVLGACRSIGLFTPRTVVIARGAELLDKKTGGKSKSSDRDQLAEYAAKPNDKATLLLVTTKGKEKLNASTRLVKGISKAGGLLVFDPLRQRDVPPWVGGQAAPLAHPMDPGTAGLIADLVGNDLQQLMLVLEQLSLYVGPGQPIRGEDVESCLASTRAHSVFEFVDAVAERRVAPALSHLHSMLEHRQEPLMILAMLTRHFRFLWQTAAAREQRQRLDAVTKKLRLPPWLARKYWNQSTKFSRVGLRSAWEHLYETDLRLKSSTGIDTSVTMERLVLELCRG